MKASNGTLLLTVALATSLTLARSATIVQWNFNSPTPDGSPSTGVITPSVGTGTASLVGGTSAAFSAGSTNDPAPASDDSGWNTSDYPPQGTSNKTAGVQFDASTLGYSNIVVRWDHRVTSSASKYFRLQYSLDGSSFADYPVPVTAFVASSTQSYYEAQTNSLAAIAGANDNANFAVRIVSEFESSAAGAGTNGYVTLGSTYSGGSGNV